MVITRIKGYMRMEYTEVIRRMETERVRTSTTAARLFDTVRTATATFTLPLLQCLLLSPML